MFSSPLGEFMKKKDKESEYQKKLKQNYLTFAKAFVKGVSKQCPVISYKVHWQYEKGNKEGL